MPINFLAQPRGLPGKIATAGESGGGRDLTSRAWLRSNSVRIWIVLYRRPRPGSELRVSRTAALFLSLPDDSLLTLSRLSSPLQPPLRERTCGMLSLALLPPELVVVLSGLVAAQPTVRFFRAHASPCEGTNSCLVAGWRS